MPEKDSITSIRKLVGFSSGASSHGSIRPWDLVPSEITVETSGAEGIIGFIEGGELQEGSFTIDLGNYLASDSAQETAKWSINLSAEKARLLCHVLVDRIPDQGLAELCDSMTDVVRFHQGQWISNLPLLPSNKTIPARLGQSYERPKIEIAED